MNVTDMTAAQLSRAIKNGEVSAERAVKAYLDRIIHKLDELNNFISVSEDNDNAMAAARDIDDGKNCGCLAGVPVAVKDNIDVEGEQTTCGSRAVCDSVAIKDAEVVARLKAAGAVIVGKTNMDEFALGSTNETSAYGSVKNVRDIKCVPGGSSGGSANCVAAGQACVALGTDTGGSVRQPAACCGVVGLKPTLGAVSTAGVRGLAPSFDCVGIFARDCDDVLAIFNVISERNDDVKLSGDVGGITVGVLDMGVSNVSKSVEIAACNAVKTLAAAGAKIEHVTVPSASAGLAAYHILSSAEVSRSLADMFRDEQERLACVGAEVKRRMVLGALVTSGARYDTLYVRAAKVRTVIKNEFACVLEKADVLICPTTPTVAARLGALSDPHAVHSSDVFTAPVSLAGLPAVSVPFGYDGKLPIGIQIIGASGGEQAILNVGKALMLAARQ